MQNCNSPNMAQMRSEHLRYLAAEISNDPVYPAQGDIECYKAQRIFFECIRRGFHEAALPMLQTHCVWLASCRMPSQEYSAGANAAELTNCAYDGRIITLGYVHTLHILAVARINPGDRNNLNIYREMAVMALNHMSFSGADKDIPRYADQADIIATRRRNFIFQAMLRNKRDNGFSSVVSSTNEAQRQKRVKAKNDGSGSDVMRHFSPSISSEAFPARPVTDIDKYRQGRLTQGARP